MEKVLKINFKSDVNPADIFCFTKNAQILFIEVYNYCRKNGLSFCVTSLKGDRENVKSISNTHETGRAFDLRISTFEGDEAMDMCLFFNHNFKNIAAISFSTGEPLCAKLKKDHIHFQVRPGK